MAVGFGVAMAGAFAAAASVRLAVAPFLLPAPRTGRAEFPASGSPAGFTAKAHGGRPSRAGVSRRHPWRVTHLRLGAELPRTPPDAFRDRNGCMRRLLPHSTRPSPTDRRVGIHDFTDLRPAQASLALPPAGSRNRPRRPSSRGFETASYPAAPPVSYQIDRQLSGWHLPLLVFRAFGAHCRLLAKHGSAQIRGFATSVGSKADIGAPTLTQL